MSKEKIVKYINNREYLSLGGLIVMIILTIAIREITGKYGYEWFSILLHSIFG